jgi:hypothetical protein
MKGHDLLEASYSSLLDGLSDVHGTEAWAPTRCAGWSVHDLVFHLLTDAQRALVAIHSPAAGPVDTGKASYWRAWPAEGPNADVGRRTTRILASALPFGYLSELYAETAHAVVVASNARSGREVVTTQGKVMTVDTLRSSLAVEATVHQLALGLGTATAEGLAEVRRVLDALLGEPARIADDVRYALVGTGRERLTPEESAVLGPAAKRLPLFG